MEVRFNHMELTFPRGALDAKTLADIYSFYGEIFGWSNMEDEVDGEPAHILGAGEQFILLAESDTPMVSPGLDHLGLLVSTRAEVDELQEACRHFGEKDARVELLRFDDIVKPEFGLIQHYFYVRYLLPLYFDVHCAEFQSN
jgi:catechol-2,3-dioxygenase